MDSQGLLLGPKMLGDTCWGSRRCRQGQLVSDLGQRATTTPPQGPDRPCPVLARGSPVPQGGAARRPVTAGLALSISPSRN